MKRILDDFFCLVNVIKDFPHLCRLFITFSMCKLVICQVEANDGHGLLVSLFIFL